MLFALESSLKNRSLGNELASGEKQQRRLLPKSTSGLHLMLVMGKLVKLTWTPTSDCVMTSIEFLDLFRIDMFDVCNYVNLKCLKRILKSYYLCQESQFTHRLN